MANNVAGETYDAFKARKRQEFNTRHGRKTHLMQQKLLRVHLQHFLLTVGAEVDRKRGRIEGICTDIVDNDRNCTGTGESIAVSRSYASEQKRLAISREAVKAERHRSARAIQKFVRRQQILRENKALENEEELPSTSVLLALFAEKAVKPTNDIFLPDVDTTPVVPPPRSTLPPYEVVIELVAVRDLVLDFAVLDEKFIETELILKRKSVVIARAVPTKQFVSSFQASRAELKLQDCSLRFSLDLKNGMKHGLASPQSVIDELIATIIVKVTGNSSGSQTNTLGVVEIPLSLLETPLATEFALCRWFPLEKAFSGHTVRGDLRASVCYLMRQMNSDNVTMIPYVNTVSSQNSSDEIEVQQQRKKSTNRKVTTIPQKVTGKSLQRKRILQMTEKKSATSEKLKPPVLSLKEALSSPIGRISRAEALSPPSSPSSVASSEIGESVESPRIERPVKTNRRFFPPKRQQKCSKPVENSPPKEEPPTETKAINNSSQLPPRNFLKRKPYKVVFHKLDWTGVASKTDSNLPTNGSNNRVNSGVASRSSKTLRSSSQASNSTVTTSNDGYAGTSTDHCINPKPGAFINAATAQRLETLETAMYEQCGVTRETASLARFKYQTERKKFLATLQSQAQGRQRNMESSTESPSQDSSEHGICTTEAALLELWKKLTGDSSGRMYASMLRGLIERPVKTIEPAESIAS